MARRIVKAETEPEPEAMPSRKVHVREHTTRDFVTVEPDRPEEIEIDEEVELAAGNEEGDELLDPVEAFLKDLKPEEEYMLKVWALPSYYTSGLVGSKVKDKLWVTKFAFGPAEVDEYQEIVRRTHNWASTATSGGKVMFEFLLLRRSPIRDGWAFKKRWEEAISSPSPGSMQTQQNNPYPVLMAPSQPAQPPPDPVRPVETLKEQMGLFKGIVEFAKDLMPAPAPPPAQNGNGDTWQEKLLLAFAGRPDAPIDKIFDAMSNGSQKAPGLLDAVIEYAPHVGPTIGQGLNALMSAWARRIEIGNQETARQHAAAAAIPSQPQIAAPVPTAAPAQQPQQQPPAPAPDATLPDGSPMYDAPPRPTETAPPPPTPRQIFEYAYRKAIQRAVEDCMEQVNISKLDPLNAPTLSPKPAAEAIYALTERFDPENWKDENAFLMDLLNVESGKLFQAQPAEVLMLCAAAAPNERAAGIIMSLTQEPAALKWVELLQSEIKAIIEEAKEEGQQETT